MQRPEPEVIDAVAWWLLDEAGAGDVQPPVMDAMRRLASVLVTQIEGICGRVLEYCYTPPDRETSLLSAIGMARPLASYHRSEVLRRMYVSYTPYLQALIDVALEATRIIACVDDRSQAGSACVGSDSRG